MPIYEFVCLNCGLEFDYLVRSSQEEIVCSGCDHKDLQRLVSLFAFSSKDASGKVTTSPTASCSSCSSRNCSTCAR